MKTEDFFIPSEIPDIPEEEYRKAEIVIDTLEALSRITFQAMFVIDYFKQKFLYVSDNFLFLCGRTAQEIKELGYRFYLENVPESEQAMLAEIYRAGFDFYKQLPTGEKRQYIMSYDFHLTNGKRTTLVNHKFTPIRLTDEGKLWLASCAVTPSTHTHSGYVFIYKPEEPVYWEYCFMSHRWEEKPKIILGDMERDILLLAAQGYTMEDMTEKLCIGLDAIKDHKRKLFKKLHVKNMMEALLFAENYKLL